MNQEISKISSSSLHKLPVRDNHNCFGCSPRNAVGLQMTFQADETKMFSYLKVPAHLGGWSNIVHGGVVSTIMDEIMAWAAIYFTHSMVMTKKIEVEFFKPVYISQEIMAVGQVVEKINKREALLKGEIFNDKKELCASASGVFALFTAEAIVRLGIMDQQTVQDFTAYFQKHKQPFDSLKKD